MAGSFAQRLPAVVATAQLQPGRMGISAPALLLRASKVPAQT